MANSTLAREPAPLTGPKVLLTLIGFFGVIFAVNGLMAYDAVSTFRGEVVDNPYEAGLAYNNEIAAAGAQEARDWRVDVSFTHDGPARIARVSVADAAGRPLEGLGVAGLFAAPADMQRDTPFALKETTPGIYVGQASPSNGVWDFELAAQRGAKTLFRSKNRVNLN